MSTTIDSLQIEIQSTSTDAVAGINDLANKLKKLNQNSLQAGVTDSLSKLADAMEKLKNVGSVGDGVKKLSGALKSLKELDYGAVSQAANSSALFERLAVSLTSLSNVKPGGLKSMVTGLIKIPEATKALDTATIDAFVSRVEELSQKLTPFSTQLTSIKTAFSAINSSSRKAGSGTKQFGGDLDSSSINLATFIKNVETAYKWLNKVINKVKEFLENAIEWDGISARFGRGFGTQAQETYEWVQRLNEELGINTQQFMQYSSIYATMLTGFGVASEDAATMALGYTELTYDIWAGYNDIYKSYADAADAVKSAIAGEVEPIRKAGLTITESTLKATAANHGLEVSLENATEAQKSYLRYLALTDAAYEQNLVGTYASELTTAEGLMRTLSQQFKSLAQSFGSLFLPVLSRAIPYMQAFVDLLKDATHWMASLFGVKIQEVDWSGYNSGVSDAVDGVEEATDAVKELKNATLGIDELNIISPNTGSGSSAGGLGFEAVDVESLWDESIFNKVTKSVDELKEKAAEVLKTALAIGIAFATWSIASSLIKDVNKLSNSLGLVVATVGIKLLIDSIEDIVINKKLTWKNVLTGAAGGAIAGGGLGAALAKKFGLAWKSSMLSGAVIGLGVSLAVMGITSQVANGVSVGGSLLTALGTALAGAGLGFTLGGFAGAGVGLALGLTVGIAINAKLAKAERHEASYQATVQAIADEAIMSVSDAVGIVDEWYQTWAPDNQVVLELVSTKETLAEDVAGAHLALQSTFDAILEDGVLAKDELGKLTDAMNKYFDAITADTSANNDIIHEALVGALGRASANGVAYYQSLIDAHNRWIITEQGAVGALQQQANEAAAVMAISAPGTAEYAEALEKYETAMQKLSEYTNAENTAKLQSYSEKIEDLKAAISSGKLDTTQLEEAKKSLEDIAGKFQSTLKDIETAKENVMLAVQTEINRAKLLGNGEAVVSLGDIKAGLEVDFASQKDAVIEAANGVGAMIAEAIGSQMFNVYDASGTDAEIPNLINTQYMPLFDAWCSAAEGVITNSDRLKAFPQKVYDTVREGMADESKFDEAVETIVADGIGAAMANLNLDSEAQAFMDALVVPFGSASVDTQACVTGIGLFVDAVKDAAGIHSPARIMIPVGEMMMAGIEEGFKTTPQLSATFDAEIEKMKASAKDFCEDFQKRFKDMSRSSILAINAITSALNMIPRSITTVHTIITKTVSAGSGSSAKTYASGGFPDQGQMFIAREAGPELVGTIGSRSAVVNNGQIVEAVASGVYDAVVSAMGQFQGNSSGDVNVYLDGKQIMNSVEKHQRDRGRQIFAGGLI